MQYTVVLVQSTLSTVDPRHKILIPFSVHIVKQKFRIEGYKNPWQISNANISGKHRQNFI